MKKILYLFFAFVVMFSVIVKPKAAEKIIYENISRPSIVYYMDCSSANNCSTWKGYATAVNDDIQYFSMSGISTSANGPGVEIGFSTNYGFVKGHHYTLTLYVEAPGVPTATTSNTTRVVSVGSNGDDAFSHRPTDFDTTTISNLQIFSDLYGGFGTASRTSALTYTFKAGSSGTFAMVTYTTKSSSSNAIHNIYGYQVIDHGATPPTASEISSALQNQFNSLNNSVGNLKDQQQQTNNKLDQAETTRNGIWGTLKSVLTGITNLPGLIWNAIKGGFEAITNGIKGLFDFFKDGSVDDANQNGFFGNFESDDNGGISGIVTSPLKFIRKIGGTCKPLEMDVLGADVELPCGDTLFWNRTDVAPLRTVWNVLFGGLIIYQLLLKLFKVIHNMKDPDNSKVEVMDL